MRRRAHVPAGGPDERLVDPDHAGREQSPRRRPHPPRLRLGPSPAGRPSGLGHLLLWTTAYVVLDYVGLLTDSPTTGSPLFFPAAGVAAAWILVTPTTSQVRRVPPLVLLATTLVALEHRRSVLGAALLYGARARRPGLGGRTAPAARMGRRDRARRGRGLPPGHPARFLSLAWPPSVAALASAPVATAAAALLSGEWDWLVPVSWSVRNSSSIIVVASSVLVLRQHLLPSAGTARDADHAGRLGRPGPRQSRSSVGFLLLGRRRRGRARLRHQPRAALGLRGGRGHRVGLLPVRPPGRGPRLPRPEHPDPHGRHPRGRPLRRHRRTRCSRSASCRRSAGCARCWRCCWPSAARSSSSSPRALTEAVQRAEQRLQLFESLSASTTDAVTVIDSDDRVVWANDAAARLLPQSGTVADWTLTDLDGLALEHDRLPHRRALTGSVVTHERVVRPAATPSGQRVVLSVSANGLAGFENHARSTVVMVLRDVTTDEDHRQQLQEFAGVVAHDLRGPLTSVSGWTEAALDGLTDAAGATRRRRGAGRPRPGAQRARPDRRPHGPHERADRGPAAARPGPRRLPGPRRHRHRGAGARGGRAPRRPRPRARGGPAAGVAGRPRPARAGDRQPRLQRPQVRRTRHRAPDRGHRAPRRGRGHDRGPRQRQSGSRPTSSR